MNNGVFEVCDKDSEISYGIFCSLASARKRAKLLAELTHRAIKVKCVEFYYPDPPF